MNDFFNKHPVYLRSLIIFITSLILFTTLCDIFTFNNFKASLGFGLWFSFSVLFTYLLKLITDRKKVVGIVVDKRRHYTKSTKTNPSYGRSYTYTYTYNDKIYKMPSDVGFGLFESNIEDSVVIYLNEEENTALPKSMVITLLLIAISQIILSSNIILDIY